MRPRPRPTRPRRHPRQQCRLLPRISWPGTDETAWAHALNVNLTAHYRMCREFTPAMIEQRWGRIISIGSINVPAGRAGLTATARAMRPVLAGGTAGDRLRGAFPALLVAALAAALGSSAVATVATYAERQTTPRLTTETDSALVEAVCRTQMLGQQEETVPVIGRGAGWQ
ncbi:SDR family NAD(P)-dependent oxidoreductase [Streptomyces sp. 110]|uniref:SDR family NAD(P)-dependent oxidoreductase n=1 Tax=Streptomyces endocoffeicus TaxID=2898945 RepID=A0ABS1PS42_9ACTN|nr:SDR family NAD(P)-dependent oxidoreductase [Streptomyces endocoffeicus]